MIYTDAGSSLTFKIIEVVTVYDVIKFLRDAWELVPNLVVLKASLETGILSPTQRQDIEDFLDNCMDTKEPEMSSRFLIDANRSLCCSFKKRCSSSKGVAVYL